MRKKYIIIILSALPLFSQGINHSQKIVIRKSPFGFNISSEIDFRTNEEGLHHRHFDFGLRFPIGKTWLTSVQYRSVYRKNENEFYQRKVFASENLSLNLLNNEEIKIYNLNHKFIGLLSFDDSKNFWKPKNIIYNR